MYETSNSFNVTCSYLQYARLFESWDREELPQDEINKINNIKKLLLCTFFNGESIFSKNSLIEKPNSKKQFRHIGKGTSMPYGRY